MKHAHRLIVPLGVLTLSACGGGGGGGGGGSGGTGPTTTSYTIGGSAQGVANYSSSGLVLLDNGTDSLTVSSDGTFTFASPVASGGAYAVTVKTQPSGETCSVTNASGTASGNVTNVTVSCSSVFASSANATTVSVGTFPSDVTAQDFNVPIVTVTVCDATTKCAPFQVMVDTGSSGLRLISSAVSAAGLALTPEAAGAGNTLFECAYYADGYAWGGVFTAAQVKIANEVGSGVPLQVIDTSAAPTSCISNSPGGNSPQLSSPNDFSADGVLGVGVAAQDCGANCENTALFYYGCPVAGGCTAGSTATTVPVNEQVTNPVTAFATDNNGVILQLPLIGASGAVGVGTGGSGSLPSGYLVFGVGTQTDNSVGSATILAVSTAQAGAQPLYISTSFNGSTQDGIIDSGSNALFFEDSSLQSQPCVTSGASFYCPGTTQSLTATNSGGGNTSQVAFQIASLDTLHSNNPSFYAFNDVGGPFPMVNGTTYFDFGLPFFYGRSVYTIIEGASVGGQVYADGAFAY